MGGVRHEKAFETSCGSHDERAGVFTAPELRGQSARPLRAAWLDRRGLLRHRHEPPAVQQVSGRFDASQRPDAGKDLRLLRDRRPRACSRRHRRRVGSALPAAVTSAAVLGAGQDAAAARFGRAATISTRPGRASLRNACARLSSSIRRAGSRCSPASPSSAPRDRASAMISPAGMTASCSNRTRPSTCWPPAARAWDEMSLVSIGVESALSRDFMSGLALEMDPSGRPVALRATLEYRGSCLASAADDFRGLHPAAVGSEHSGGSAPVRFGATARARTLSGAVQPAGQPAPAIAPGRR